MCILSWALWRVGFFFSLCNTCHKFGRFASHRIQLIFKHHLIIYRCNNCPIRYQQKLTSTLVFCDILLTDKHTIEYKIPPPSSESSDNEWCLMGIGDGRASSIMTHFMDIWQTTSADIASGGTIRNACKLLYIYHSGFFPSLFFCIWILWNLHRQRAHGMSWSVLYNGVSWSTGARYLTWPSYYWRERMELD